MAMAVAGWLREGKEEAAMDVVEPTAPQWGGGWRRGRGSRVIGGRRG